MRALHSIPQEVKPRPYPDIPLWTKERYEERGEIRGPLLDAWRNGDGEAYALWSNSMDPDEQYVIYVMEERSSTSNAWIDMVHNEPLVYSWSIWDDHTLTRDLKSAYYYDEDGNEILA